MNEHNRATADDHAALASEIERHDGNIFLLDVKPDVEFGPIREGKDANRLSPLLMRELKMFHSSGRWFLGSHCPWRSRNE